jgi:type I restriction enzyme S subunit
MTEALDQIQAAQPRRFRPYPEYKDSGVEWLSVIPAHWQVLTLKRIGDLQAGAGFPENEQGIKDEEVPFFKVGDMGASGNERVMREWQHSVSLETARRLRAFVFPVNTIVFAKVGAALLLNRRRSLVVPSCIDNNMMGFMPIDCDPDWAMYWLAGLDMGELANPGAVPSVNEGQMRQTPVIVPPREEQLAIAAFLEHATTRIDELIARKERLIELLQEKRTALIACAVTRGLDPSVPMKDSGVAWLGRVPAHWQVKRTKFAARLRSGHTPSRQNPEYWEDCTIPWFGLADVWQIRNGQVEYVYETTEKISELGLANSSARLLPKNTVILSRTASVGFSAILGVEMATTQDFVNWVCGPALRPEFLLYVFRAMGQEFRRLTMGSTHQTIYMPDVGEFSTPIPPVSEQESIVACIREEAVRIDALEAKIVEAIEHLKEFRTALISAAVTGKIDVREEVQ